MTTEVYVKGLADIQKFLDTLPAKIEKNLMRGALRAGAKLIAADARARAPVGPPNAENVKLYGGYPGALRDSIRVSTRVKAGKVTATIKAGGKNSKTRADVFYAHMVEFGTKAHFAHPGTKPQKFMRPALDSQASAAVQAAAAYLREKLATKHGLDTSGIILDGDE